MKTKSEKMKILKFALSIYKKKIRFFQENGFLSVKKIELQIWSLRYLELTFFDLLKVMGKLGSSRMILMSELQLFGTIGF